MDEREILLSIKPYLATVARRYAQTRTQLREEYLQEAMIAAWQAYQNHDPAKTKDLRYHMMQIGVYRIKKVHTRGNVFGRPESRGIHRPTEEIAQPDYELDTTAYDQPNLAAAHAAEIWDAVKAEGQDIATQVYRKFWLDEPVVFKTRWYTQGGVRDRLAQRLTRLEELA